MAASRTALQGSAALLIWGNQVNFTATDERDLNDWWTNEHIPERLDLPGFNVARRYYYLDNSTETNEFKTGTVQAEPKNAPTDAVSHYMALYDVDSLESLTSPAYMQALDNPTPATQKFMPVLARMNRSACKILVSVVRKDLVNVMKAGTGGTMAHVIFNAPTSTENRADLIAWIGGEGWKMTQEFFSGILSTTLLEQDEDATHAGNATSSYKDVSFQHQQQKSGNGSEGQKKWMMLVEFAEPFRAPWATYQLKCKALAEGFVRFGVDLSSLREEIYGLLVSVAK
jgi:hypothetical protein